MEDCIKNDFVDYYPKKIVNLGTLEKPIFKSKYFGFYYHNDLTKDNIFERLNCRIERFKKIIKETTEKVIFIRTIVSDKYQEELNLSEKFIEVIKEKNQNLGFILIFIIPEQDITEYFTNIGKKTFIFTLNDKSHDNCKLGAEYKPIFDYINQNNLFLNIPKHKDKK